MIFITGDTHGDFRRFSSDCFEGQKNLTKEDFVIICGDFGIWDNSKGEQYWFEWLNEKPFTTLFVTGNHSNYDLLKQFPIEKWHGGEVQFIRDSIIHLRRGQVFSINEKRFFTMGGASSHDIKDGILELDDPHFTWKKKRLDLQRASYRINHKTWWKEELPSDDEYAEARKNLDQCGWEVDYILTHCCPSTIVDCIDSSHYHYNHDALTDFFEEVKANCKFKYWFFGHYHDNRTFQEKFILTYEKIRDLSAPDAQS